MRIGVLALQGAFIEHIDILRRLNTEALQIRLPGELNGLDGLIIPGGESTTISRLMAEFQLMQPIRDLAREGLPVLGTCAGMVLLSSDVLDFELQTLGLMDITVRRNVFGSQLDSFEIDLKMPALGPEAFHAIFIRAPIIEKSESTVEKLAILPDGKIVAARQGKLIAAAFHPELTDDLRFHEYFLKIITSG